MVGLACQGDSESCLWQVTTSSGRLNSGGRRCEKQPIMEHQLWGNWGYPGLHCRCTIPARTSWLKCTQDSNDNSSRFYILASIERGLDTHSTGSSKHIFINLYVLNLFSLYALYNAYLYIWYKTPMFVQSSWKCLLRINKLPFMKHFLEPFVKPS